MQKNLLSKTFVIGVIVLFMGVGVSSAISIDIKPRVSNNESVEDCNCKEIDSRHLVVLERQLNRLEVYSKGLLVLSKYNSKLKEECEELSNEITILKEELTDDPPFPLLCEKLENIILNMDKIWVSFYELGYSLEQYPLICYMWWKLGNIVEIIVIGMEIPIIVFGLMIDCWEWDPWEP